MGSVFGKSGVEEAAFEVVRAAGSYEIRKYPPLLVAETFYDNDSNAFRALAGFIFGKNSKQASDPEKIAMTAPVMITNPAKETIAMTAPVMITNPVKENIAMTAPVVIQERKMMFVMPKEFTMENIPKPTDPRVTLHQQPGETLAVLKYSGWAPPAGTQEKQRELEEALKKDNVKLKEGAIPRLAQYNPPWTLPFLRRNEIMLPVEV
mmetsp:Transcript_41717/g.67679  ORF Transcript_41717/g.67679 Transcript_41717/m.67679 type:complete len:207 (+) Transcript_41717:183-803(+)